jgi:amino acid adenylation domain-containing protein
MAESIKSPELITQKKRALIELLLKEKRTLAPVSNRIPCRTPAPYAPLSFAQEQMWFLDQLNPGSSLYNLTAATRFKGKLDIAAFEMSLGEILRRHEVLRATYDVIEGKPVQIVHEAPPQRLPIVDLSSLEAGEREAVAQRMILEEGRRPFDLKAGPIIRANILRLSEYEHLLLLTMHHICTDGWSIGALYREMEALYEAFSARRQSPLAELPIQYADYAVWQRQRLQGERLEELVSFWRRQLEDAAVGLDLPTDKPRLSVQSHNGGWRLFDLPPSLTRDLRTFSQREGVTLVVTLLAAFKALLFRYTDQNDILVGTPAVNRARPEIESLIGMFLNTLVLRTKVEGAESFRSLVARVRETVLAAHDHQELPIEKLVEELQPDRDLSRNPLFQVMFNFMVSKPSMSLPGLVLNTEDVYNRTSKFDLELSLWDTGDQLGGRFEYCSDLFEAETITRLCANFQRLLSAAVASPDDPVAALPIVSAAERRQLVEGWNATATDFPTEPYLHQLFEVQAARRPDSIALTFEQESITYQELNRRANQLANYLHRLGVGSEARVGICLERGLDLVISIYAVLKAGGAYIPLDPESPKQRLAYQAEEAQAGVLITERRWEQILPQSGARLICLDQQWDEIARSDDRNPNRGLLAENLAYVIYTSGSTGKPKGAMNTHRGILNRIQWMQQVYQLNQSDCVLQKTPYSFDVSVWEFLWPLMSGARLVVARPGGHRESRYLAELIEREQVTTLHFVPAMLSAFLEEEGLERCRSLRWVICSGEELGRSLQERYWDRMSAQLENLYGPTEAAVDVTYWSCERGSERAVVPIGRPIANTQIYILDERLEPAPVGVRGEIYIGGTGLARGYVNRPELTAERFIAHPHSVEPGHRLYKTGDAGRYQADGAIEFLGRRDRQVKVRGFRIELGEIEAVLRRHGAIGDAAVVAREDSGGVRLVAYVVGRGSNDAPGPAELREWLGNELPSYMTPSAFVALESLPLTSSGKLDRKALPEPETVAEREPTAPRTSVEEILVGVWAEALRLKQVDVEENFFELGGHSLLATQVISRVRQFFGVDLPLRALFESPTIAGLARRIEVARGERADAVAPPALAPVAGRGTQAPISFAQQRLWFLDQLAPDNSFYNVPVAVRMQGRLDAQAFERSLDEIVVRHEALRTTFPAVDGQPTQSVAPTLPLALPVIDLRGFSQDERETQSRLLAAEEARRPFNLAKGPLLRVKLLRLGEEDHVALLTMHHIVSDGWSMGVLLREVAALYEAYSQGMRSPLDELPIQYADYAVWQREWLSGEVLEAQLAYWRRQLAGLPILNLPTDHPRPVVQGYRGAAESLQLPASLTDSLKELSQRNGVTLFMTLLAAFQTLLMRHTGQEDVTVGSPVANRGRAELEGLIGLFINTLALRTDLSGDPSFTELLGRVREAALGAYAHQDLPFERLVEELQPERDLGRHPLFQVMMVLQNAPGIAPELPGLKLSELPFENATTKFDLTLALAETGPGLSGYLEYSTELFEEETVRRMLGQYRKLLESVVEDPQAPLSELEVLTEEERERLLVEWNRTEADYPRDQCVHELFEQQVELTPERTALSFEDEQLSYAELNRRANRLARHLSNLGVGPDARVAICLERSIDMVVALLATLKAGGAYVPLDPAYPEERLAFMMEDAEAQVALTQRQLLRELPQYQPQVVCLEEMWKETAKYGEENLGKTARPNNLAYVIYTSGSTGKPKGVQIPHGAVVNFLASMQVSPGITREDKLLSVTSLSFDISVLEIILPLMSGAQLSIVHRDTTLNGEHLSKALVESQATVIQATPTTYQLLIDSGWGGSGKLKILCGGEAMSLKIAAHLYERCGSLWNVYGPTETTIWSTLCQVHPENKAPSIGRPIRNTQCYILDGNLTPTPIGTVGQLCIGGAGLARGYRNLPAITADRFIPDPFSQEPGARLYRTGDLARYRGAGCIEFLGRNDFQVKVRGFRIEMGEIEALLNQHHSIRQAIVTVIGDDPNTLCLAAYVVLNRSEASISELRQYLRMKLPEYMVPATWMVLENLPLMPNGKVNRRALPVPEHRQVESVAVAARTPSEEILAGIWREVLRTERVGVHDNFFELGGHSLLGTQLISRVRNVFAIELPLRVLFENPTVEGLALRVDAEMQAANQDASAPPIAPVIRDAALPISFAQQRLWFLDQLAPDNSFYNVPVAVRMQGRLDAQAFERSLDEIVVRHEALRTTFPAVDGQPTQSVAPTLPLALPVIDLRGFSQDERETQSRLLAAEEARRPFNLAKGPLLRVKLLRLGEEDHVALLTMHHIVSDGWSMGVLLREVAALYEAYSQGMRSPLDELPIQYADYAVWQREWLSGEVLEAQLAYWRRQLAGLPILNLPTDHPRPVVQGYRGAAESLQLPASLTDSLKELSQRNGVTLFMTLLAAFQTLLMRHTGQEDVTVGSPVANRGRAELEGLIGLFINTLALRTDLSGDPSFTELLGRVREAALGAYAHQDLPFERLVEELQPERDLGRHPLFQVMMVLQNAPGIAPELPGLKLSELPFENATTKFDLTLALAETGPGLSGYLEYSTELFEEETVRRMLGQYRKLLESVVEDPQAPLSELEVLTEEERERLLVEWNRTEADYPRDQCVHELFEQQVELTPERTALSFEDEQLSYAELNRRANRLARHLSNLGVGPDARVAICLERSIDMVVALLATLKAGGAYVPLDPAYPAERLALMLEDIAPAVLLTNGATKAALAGRRHETCVVDLDADAPSWAAQIARNLDRAGIGLDTRCLAYVIYTSGSTGLPKGVMVEHQGLRNLLFAQIQNLAVDPGSHVLQSASFSFDGCIFQVMMALCRGALLVLPPHGQILAGDELVRFVTRHDVSHAALQPAMLAGIPRNVSLEGIRTLIVAGEAVTRELVQQWSPGRRMINDYGPTEATVSATYYDCRGDEQGPPPIGRPIANKRIYILDKRHQPTPIKAPGEIYLGGVGVARGYLNQPRLTAECFLPDPFTKEPGARIYKSGDLCRWAPDGNIEFLGRNDFQVKIRGFRVELGEIEAALRKHPRVHEAVVLARQDSPGEKRLVAYLVCDRESAPTAGEARAFLKERLPEYMVPSAFVPLDELPLSSNGKVDRRALPAPNHARPEGAAAYLAPRTPAEEVIAAIWSQALGIESVGVYDNFFELGGHSLLVNRVVSRVREAFGIELPLRVIFESPVLAEFASSIELEIQFGSEPDTFPLEPISRDQPIPLSLSQQKMLTNEQMNPGTASNNVPILIRLSGELDLAALEWSLGEIIRRHEILRTTFETSGGVACQVIHPPAPIRIPVVDITRKSIPDRETYARRLAYKEGQRPFDLAVGPLVRASVMRLSAEEYLLLLVIHHIVIDPWSLSLFMQELTTLCGMFGQGGREAAPPLPELPVQFADYAVWQRKWLQGEALKRLHDYWRERLGGRLQSLNLPRKSKARRLSKIARGAACPVKLPASLSGQIKMLSLNEGATPFISMLAAFKATLYLYTGNTDIIVTSPMANRHHREVESLIGFFANSVALRTTFDEGASFRELLRNVRETAIGAYMRQALPLDKVVEALGEETDLSEKAIGRVNFALLTLPVSQQEMGKLGSQIIDVEVGVASSDLALTLLDTSEGYRGKFNYRTDMFDEKFMLRMAERFQRLLQSVVSDPDQKLCNLSG